MEYEHQHTDSAIAHINLKINHKTLTPGAKQHIIFES
jgi:hypothetical protein